MYVTIVHISVKPENIAAFKDACRLNHQSSINEPGNLRFDVLQSTDEPTNFVLYEAYKTPQNAAAHKESVHYQTWRETVADWMAKPRQGITYNGLYPMENE
jgi:(4S)-4-hydroxy-5-phosphonooxypentane-2,3-dione isomerase